MNCGQQLILYRYKLTLFSGIKLEIYVDHNLKTVPLQIRTMLKTQFHTIKMQYMNTMHCFGRIAWISRATEHTTMSMNTDGFVQDYNNSIINALRLLQSFTKPSIWWYTCMDVKYDSVRRSFILSLVSTNLSLIQLQRSCNDIFRAIYNCYPYNKCKEMSGKALHYSVHAEKNK